MQAVFPALFCALKSFTAKGMELLCHCMTPQLFKMERCNDLHLHPTEKCQPGHDLTCARLFDRVDKEMDLQ